MPSSARHGVYAAVNAKLRPEILRELREAGDQLPRIPTNQHYARGTKQNLTAEGCVLAQPTNCRGSFWYRLFPGSAWDHNRLPERPLPAARARLRRARQPRLPRRRACRSQLKQNL